MIYCARAVRAVCLTIDKEHGAGLSGTVGVGGPAHVLSLVLSHDVVEGEGGGGEGDSRSAGCDLIG